MTTTCKARVRKDGTLLIPKAAREELGLRQGDEVEVVLNRATGHAEDQPAQEDNPLLRIIGLASGETADGAKNPLDRIIGLGKGRPDGAENHDKYLYGKRSD